MIANRSPEAARSRQAGFTLWEVLIAGALISVLGAILIPNIASTVDYGNRQETESRLTSLKSAIRQAYAEHAMSVDDSPSQTINLLPGGNGAGQSSAVLRTGPSRPPAQRTQYQEAFAMLGRYAGLPGGRAASDGFNAPWQVYVSNRLSRQWRGYAVYYHVIALVSNQGGDVVNGQIQLDPGTGFDFRTGELTLGGDDAGITVSGFPIQTNLFETTIDRMNRFANIYEGYFRTNFKSNAQRDRSVDYFSQACPGQGTNENRFITYGIKNSCNRTFDYPAGNTNIPFTPQSSGRCNDARALIEPGTGFDQAFGITDEAVRTAWGYTMGYGVGPSSHCGSQNVYSRNPQSRFSDYRDPPYTALIMAWAPGGVPIVVTASGAY